MPFVFLILSLAVTAINILHSNFQARPTPTPAVINTQADNQRISPYPTTDPDPVIDCYTKSMGTIRERRSTCTASIDCLINGKYYLAKNNDECNTWVKQAQPPQNTYQQPVYQYNPSQYTYPTVQPYTPPTTTSNNNSFNDCMAAVNTKRDVCNQNCYAQRDTSGDQQFTGNNDPYLLCLDNCQTSNPYNCSN